MNKTHFERAVFLSWYCGRGDCKFCYMSTQKKLIKEPRKARRSTASILAEVIICKKLGWEIEFLSGGYESYTLCELVELVDRVYSIYGKKLWLNMGVLSESELLLFKPYITGVCGAVECVDPNLHKDICPSKPIPEIEKMFKTCDKLGLNKAMTMIVGLGETISDFSTLKKFINKNKVDKITFYRLKPQKDTSFTQGPDSSYFVSWIEKTRLEFPELNIVAGSWLTHLNEVHSLLSAGANAITKFPSIRLFGSESAKKIESEAKLAGFSFEGSLTKMPKVDWKKEVDKLSFDPELKNQIYEKVCSYVKKMK